MGGGVGVGGGVGAPPDEVSNTIVDHPGAAAESVDVSKTDVVDGCAWYTASPRHVGVGPVPSVHVTGFVHVNALSVIGKLKAMARSFICDGVTVGVVYVARLFMNALEALSVPDAFDTSTPIHVCWRCAACGVNTYRFVSPEAVTCVNS